MSDPVIPPKFCPRCGAFFRDMPSATCPQCFARLEVMDQGDAVQIEQVADARREDSEYIEAKAAEDEKYKEQAFGGCFGVVAIAVATVIIAAVIVYTGLHRKLPQPTRVVGVSFDNPASVMPPKLAGVRRVALISRLRSPSVPFAAVRATYTGGLDVFAASATLPPLEHEAFRVYANMAPDLNVTTLKHDEIVAHGADYIVFSPSVDQLRRAVNELAQ